MEVTANTNVVIATYSGATPDVSGWRVVRSDGARVYGHVTAGNGEIRISMRKGADATMLFVR